MKAKTGSQVIDVFGVEVELVNGSLISKRDAQRAIQKKLDVTDRQARAAVSSLSSEGWMEQQSAERYRINDGIAAVSSFENRVMELADGAAAASEQNGKRGGRPIKEDAHHGDKRRRP